ncbi:hypothetical protein ACA910_011144 [Epithemia clementina (nom. ined.)]
MEANGVNSYLIQQKFSFIEREAISAAILLCAPFGLQNLSAPTEENAPPSPDYSWSPKFRFLDGAYIDNTAIVHAVSRMQADCLNQSAGYDCSQGIRMIALYANSAGLREEIPRLFANCNI